MQSGRAMSDAEGWLSSWVAGRLDTFDKGGNPMRARRLPAIFALLAAVLGCEEKVVSTASDPASLGRQIVEAIAKVAGEEPGPAFPRAILRPRVPLDLAMVAIVDDWGAFTDTVLAEELAKYMRGEFPGTIMDCDPSKVVRTGRNCFPLSPDGASSRTATGHTLPPDGMLILSGSSSVVGVHHYYPVTWNGAPGIDDVLYMIELQRLDDGGWKVGEGRHTCCS